MASGNPRAGLRGGISAHWHWRALRPGRLAAGGHQRCGPRRLPAPQLLEVATDDFLAPATPLRRRVPAPDQFERPRARAIGVRLSPDVPGCRAGPLDA